MKSSTATSLAALVAAVYSSTAYAAPIDATNSAAATPGPVTGAIPATSSINGGGVSSEDKSIQEGIRFGIQRGLQNALSDALGISLDHDLVRKEEVDQVEQCIGSEVNSIIVNCIKKENLSAHSRGDDDDTEKHTEAIQKCISPQPLEHIEYCVGKLEIQRLGKDAKILQQLYEASNLKKEEKDFDDGDKEEADDAESEVGQDASLLFNQDWYDTHKDRNSDGSSKVVTNDKDLVAKTGSDAPPPAPASSPASPGSVDGKSGSQASGVTTGPTDKKEDRNADKKEDPNAPVSKPTDTDVPFVKRKFGYGPDWQTAPGVRDPHPLNRRSDVGDVGLDNQMGALRDRFPRQEDESEYFGSQVLVRILAASSFSLQSLWSHPFSLLCSTR
jgi:hypothetical protein